MSSELDRSISVLICDDHRVLTDVLAAYLRTRPGVTLVHEPVDTAEEAICICAAERPDVVVMDIELSGAMNGIEGTGRIKAVSPGTRVVIMSGRLERDRMFAAASAGASGFVTKTEAARDLVRVVRSIAAGEVLLDPALLADAADSRPVVESDDGLRDRLAVDAALASLTPRERDVLLLLSQGLRNETIAERLYVSHHTVKSHIKNILAKLGVHSKLQAVAYVAHGGVFAREPAVDSRPPTARRRRRH